MDTFEIVKLWSEYGDRLACNPEAKLATFKTKESARSFKLAAPEWTSQYLWVPGFNARVGRKIENSHHSV